MSQSQQANKPMSKRNVHGILLLDKRLGVSSNRALQEVKRLFQAKKAGHTGSLDPLASGLLPLCFGEATKVSGLMLDADKRYTVKVQLGKVTDTGDLEGKVIAVNEIPKFWQDNLDSVLNTFVGEIEQIPPMYSALKHNGKKYYELAREGKQLERKARNIKIFEIKRRELGQDNFIIDVHCSKGTYIRSLAEDIGKKLGCGATVSELRRTASGQFDIKNSLTIEQLKAMSFDQLDGQLIAVDKPLENFPSINLNEQMARAIKHGQAVQLTDVGDNIGKVRMYCKGDFLGLGEALLSGKLLPKKIFSIDSNLSNSSKRTDRVSTQNNNDFKLSCSNA